MGFTSLGLAVTQEAISDVAPQVQRSVTDVSQNVCSVPSSAPTSSSAEMDLDAALEELEHGSKRTVQEGRRLLLEFEELGRRHSALNEQWSQLRKALCCGLADQQPFDTAKVLHALEEASQWQAALHLAFRRAELLKDRLVDVAEQGRERQEDKLRWKGMSNKVLSGLDPVSAIVAVSALRRNGPSGCTNEAKFSANVVLGEPTTSVHLSPAAK